jgi:phosphoglycolate phosphatase
MLLCFDLDGTLTDSAPGIVASLNYALTELEVTAVPDDQLRALIGSPLRVIFQRLLADADDDRCDRAIAAYRQRFDQIGLVQNQLFPGIADALHQFRAQGHRLAVVTAKPTTVAERVLAHFAIDHFFESVHGATTSTESCDKADCLAAALRHAQATPHETVMIGDRVDDVLAANACGVRMIGVEWGYGSRDELETAGATFIAPSVSSLIAWLSGACAPTTLPASDAAHRAPPVSAQSAGTGCRDLFGGRS